MCSEVPSLRDRLGPLFVFSVGAFLSLSLLKFGNPIILDYKLSPPANFWEYLLWAWPVAWGYALLVVLMLWSAGFVRWPGAKPPWIVWLPLAWLLWQSLSATQTVRWALTEVTLKHFAVAVVCFYLGLLALGRQRDLSPMWLALLAGFIGVVAVGFDQHFGGLEATRKFIYAQPDWQNQPPEFLKKIASNRIYATLFYPNALAGAVLLFLPPLLAFALTMTAKRTLRWGLAATVGLGGLACLYWSGSKAGWLIALVVGLLAWLQVNLGRKLKWLVVAGVLAAGLAGFFLKHAAYFEKGATSVGARFDCWRAALQITTARPGLGSGPGTFSVLYRQLRPPEAEPARLAHNDYLQQACDSGVAGGALYTVFVLGSLACLYRRPLVRTDWVRFAVWLGLVAWGMQGFVEFGLYIPALAWPAFLFLGWLWALHSAPTETKPDTKPV